MRDEMVGVADRPGRVVGRLCGVIGRLYGVVGIIRVAHVFRVARFKSCATGCRATRAEGLRAGRKKSHDLLIVALVLKNTDLKIIQT